MGQNVYNGAAYATYKQVEKWLDDHLVGVGGVAIILKAAGLA